MPLCPQGDDDLKETGFHLTTTNQGGLGRGPRLQPQVLRLSADLDPPWGAPTAQALEAVSGSRLWTGAPLPQGCHGYNLKSWTAGLVGFSTFSFYFILACKFVGLNHIFLVVGGKAVLFSSQDMRCHPITQGRS